MIKINLDVKNEFEEKIALCKAGDRILLSGTFLTARDAAHKELKNILENGQKLPYNFINSIIYYAGPTDTPPNKTVGAIGPTTSARMDSYANYMKILGVKAVIGKGERSCECKEIYARDGIYYFIATGGCGALLSKCVTKCEVVCFDHLGCESVKKLTVSDFPVTLCYDSTKGDIFNG